MEIDVLKMVNPEIRGSVDPVLLSYFRWVVQVEREREALIRRYRDYYAGKHDARLTDRQAAYLSTPAGKTFQLNYMPVVIDPLCERLHLTVLNVESLDGTANEAATEAVKLWWKLNQMESEQSIVHRSAIRDGDSFVIVSWDNERGIPTFTQEPAFDGEYGMTAYYDESDSSRLLMAAKRWRTKNAKGDPVQRLTIYTDSAVFKFTSDVSEPQRRLFNNWKPLIVDGEEWPVRWVDRKGEPLGLPVVHFKAKADGGTHGTSALDDVIPAQDALNKTVIDLLALVDTAGFPIHTMIGDAPLDSEGNVIQLGAGSWIWSEDSETKIGRIEPTNPAAINDVVDAFVMRIAQISRTPLVYFQASKQVASDETQEANDSGIQSRAAERAAEFGGHWAAVITQGLRLASVFGSLAYDPLNTIVVPEWDSFRVINESKEVAELASVKETMAATFISLYDTIGDAALAAELAGYPADVVTRLAKLPSGGFIDDGVEL